MQKTYIVIDGNSIGHAAQASTKLKVGAQEVQAIFGFLRSVRPLFVRYPSAHPIVLWDGRSWRKDAFTEYKANRDREETKSEKIAAAEKAAFQVQRPYIEKAMTLLGVPQLKAINMEADDLAGILVEKFEREGHKALLVSGDKDWIQLIGPSVTWFDPIRDKRISPANLLEKHGVATPRQFLEMKALMGDTGDNIPGVGGIGEKTAVKLLSEFESVKNLSNLMLEGSLPKQGKIVERFLREGLELFARNVSLMDLRSGPHRPAPINMRLKKEAPNLENFRIFCERLVFRSILRDFDNWCAPFCGTLLAREAA
ncbi:5'-3' exonuclease H3TH domain-containing protein [Aureimonas sp. AU40]|uniref:5'-3' exonuclease H3TH domain-containing protein n=1 Tax=Aureimonas sp. AU40 TaxID=1637747 RepID=UPI000783F5FF|nr:5'-3' exonuclease H3TH domain-containing protein [Aureimonas sp. AU40]